MSNIIYVRTAQGTYKYEAYQKEWLCLLLDTGEDFILFPEEYPIFW